MDLKDFKKDPFIERTTFQKGEKRNEYEIIEYLGYKLVKYKNDTRKEHYWKCKCNCGNLFVSSERAIKQNFTKSCLSLSAEFFIVK